MKGIEITRQTAPATVTPLNSSAHAAGLPAGFITPRPSRSAWLFDGQGWAFVRPATDVVALLGALALTINWPSEPVAVEQAWPILLFPAVTILTLFLRGMYERRMRVNILDGIGPVASAVSVAAMAVAMIAVYVSGESLELSVLGHLWALGLAFVGTGRVGAITAQHVVRSRRVTGRPTLIVGAGTVGTRISRRLAESPEYGLRPVGFLDADPLVPVGDVGRSLPVLGGPGDLERVARLTGAQHVVLAFSSAPDGALVPLVRSCEELGLEISVVPRLFDSVNDRFRYESLGGMPLLGLRATNTRGRYFALKHLIDRVAAGVLVLIGAPLLGAIALAVRLESPGPVLFRQRRVGRDGRAFDLLKFRSMAPLPEGESFEPAEGTAPGGVEGVDRRTRIGRFLRRTSLDELPQLINVLRGEMSLVGPRPERPEFVELFNRDINRYEDRLRVKSGITGWAQVHGLRGQTSLADRVEWDNFYIEHWSLSFDLKILALTVVAVFRAAE
jgi:exopolysaccharide biosynthesis polyprenyl glycosylphosphotransferase